MPARIVLRDLPPLSRCLALATELAVLAAVCLLVGLLASRLDTAGLQDPAQAFEILAFATATILLGVAA